MKILIVEDNFVIQMFLETILLEMGHEIVAAVGNAEEALRQLQMETPDIALLDIGLSGRWNGIELAQMITEKHGVPFAFLTGNSDEATLQGARRTDPVHIIFKPIDEQKLRAEMRHVEDTLKVGQRLDGR